MHGDNSYVKIDLDVIAKNFDRVAQKAGVPVMAIIKADAYGHGAVQVARHLQKKAAFFGVSSMLEAIELRRAGLDLPILILGHAPASTYEEAVRQDIRLTVFRYEDALDLSKAAVKLGKTARFHFAVDTGMSRIGFPAQPQAAQLCARIAALPGLEAEGLFSHFATADCRDLCRAKMQAERFDAFAKMLADLGVKPKFLHLNNSAGIMNFEEHYDLVRAGIVLYGLYPSSEVDPALLPLQPAISWHSRIAHIKKLPAGCQIGYGGAYTTQKETVVATIPVGYADGYRRSLSDRFYVLIRGKRAPILGRICMDQMMVDVTDIPDAAQGDPVTLVGTDGEETVTVEQIAEAAGSFNYEFVCGISRRVPRLYWKDGKQIRQVSYLLD